MTEDEQELIRSNPGYALGQLAKALLGKGETAAKKIQQWQQVLTGMAQGLLQIGSRTPVTGTPPWVTLEVVHGGFATGNLAAGGALKRYEIDKILELQKRELAPAINIHHIKERAGRLALNIHFAGENGRQELSSLLRSGCFRIHIAEEAALLIATWLIEKGETQRGSELLEVLGPFFDRLRFYPEPASEPLHLMSGELVYLQPAGVCAKRLREKRQQKSVVAMNESIQVWTPLYDRAVILFLETVEGKRPELLREKSGELARAENGQTIAEGGWPCKHFPADWATRATALLQEYEDARKVHGLCKKPDKPKENFARLRQYLLTASENPEQLSGRDVGSIRKILAAYVTAHGAPESECLQKTRSIQRDVAQRPLYTTLAKVLADRLDEQPKDDGVQELDRLLVPLSQTEALKASTSEGTAFPASIIRRALLCGEATLSALVEQRLISSGETMASVLPMLTARSKAASISDPQLVRVFDSVYRAFRRRRSLLLLNLGSQVRFDELPWIAAIQPWVGFSEGSRAAARATFSQASSLAISAFPNAIIPNKLVKELGSLAKDAEISIPLVDELAADIFMGSFSVNFLKAGQKAGQLLKGTIYQRYYGIDYDHILSLNDIEQKWSTQISPGFARICVQMAANELGEKTGMSVAYNGAIIERAQIITTHNLASLWQTLDISDLLKPRLAELALSSFKWICKHQQFSFSEWRAELKSIKNCAYAWRQMLFYVSICSQDEQSHFLSAAEEHFSKQSDEFRKRFVPAMIGLACTMKGAEFDNDGHHSSGGRRFTGWTTKPHFLCRQSSKR